jgi:hypothetical protein
MTRAEVLENLIVASTPGGIEAQEASEQRRAVAAQRLPKEGTSGASRAAWERMGFAFGNDADDLFVNVAFPKGWRLQATDHSMWNHLLDDKGRQRASMFYKGAFYDRKAHVHLDRRYSVDAYHDEGVVALDCGAVVRNFGTLPKQKGYDRAVYERRGAMRKEAEAWLTAEHPDWEDPLAYWD